jgi:3-dehydroquinate synthase
MDHPNISWEVELENLFHSIQEEIEQASSIYILIDEKVSEIWLNDLLEQCPQIAQANIIEIPEGEACKEWEILHHVWEQWIEDKADRNALVINIGGGSTTDLGGLAASLYKRGISFVNVPTTLTGMVDAAIGGKTAINFHHIKNSIGTFQDADQLIVCPLFLESLSEEELLSGFAEMIKHSLIADESLWEAYNELEEISAATITPFIKRNIQIKNHIVFEDPFEENIRKQLNFGHTLGHALESYWLEKQQPCSHGYCVALGMKYATELSIELEEETKSEIVNFLDEIFPTPNPMPHWDDLLVYLNQDKKNQKGNLQFTLLAEIGQAVHDQSVTWEDAQTCYRKCFHIS